MLFLLTGEIQTGKTRWLECLTSHLADDDVICYGVMAPGVWRERTDGAATGELEKLGIENVLLPAGERVAFARRRDLSQREGSFDPSSQSAAARLAWSISDAALARVNDHFASIAACAKAGSIDGGMLVVDELGRLELLRGGGLTEAVALLEVGPTTAFPHAIAVVRAGLLEHAEARLASRWDGCEVIFPGEAGRHAVCSAFGL